MGLLVEGVWNTDWYDTKSTGGRFVRNSAAFRNWVTPDGSPGPSGEGGFKAEAGRYHLIVSYACPWAHRTMILRKLKGLEDKISLNAVEPLMLENGWTFAEPDPVTGAETAWQVYVKADPVYTGRATVPILWDTKTKTIVSNESAEILRMFNSAFNGLEGVNAALDVTPSTQLAEIDAVNARVYDTVNNGVYKAGFATAQDAYEEAVTKLFETLEWLEEKLDRQRYLIGDAITEADWRLFTTLLRFDPVYVGHFKCNIRRIADYPNLFNYLKELYQHPGIAETCDFETIKAHYYGSHDTINPTGIIPVGPALDLTAPHDRGRLQAAA
ncbi:glutathione S-transferase family protein [Stappia stellulata]|uniref:glutathione S-transferase family protein n=1 Tax=Stappia stellulata TaxID=71235 RepID=UPI001CD7498E|nr:glutathione S-transferase family protein [Stappia stellulata]MCA1242301.1 glutathione S-transferase family protein [Stappia stellulata]